MNYIISHIDRRINFLEASNDKSALKVQLQAKFEFYLILMLGYMWSNLDRIEEEDKLHVCTSILRPSVGSIVSILRTLDVDKSLFGNKKYKTVQDQLNKYPQLRNEKIGHGYSFEDDLDSCIKLFKDLITVIEEQNYMFFTNEKTDIIHVKGIRDNQYYGINYKAEGFDYTVWHCSKEVDTFEIDSLYLYATDMNYTKIGPFVLIEDEDNFYTFSNVQDKLTGRSKFNKLIKTGVTYKDISSFRNLNVLSDGIKKRALNGTVINNFSNNFKRYIDVGIKGKIKNFLTTNKSSVFATLWGHGGVGKTASIQSLCEDLSNQDKKIFDYIIFLSAKDRYYNYYKGVVENIDEKNISTFEEIIMYINNVLFSNKTFDLEAIVNFEGYILLIIDDFETFAKEENRKISKFISSLDINRHKVLITTRAATLISGEEISTNELSEDETVVFLKEAIGIEVPSFVIETILPQLTKSTVKTKLHQVTGGRPLFIFQFAILLGQKGNLMDSLEHDIKGSQGANVFLYDRLYDYLSLDAKNMFLAASLLVSEDDLSNLVSKLRFILNKEGKEAEFRNALNELIKLKIIEIEDKDFFKVYSVDILRIMKKYYDTKGEEYDGSITSRFNLVTIDKKLSTDTALLANADASRPVNTEAEVEGKYRHILNREKSPTDVKLRAALNFGEYLFSNAGKIDKALDFLKAYNHLFSKEWRYVIMYARYSWSEGSKENRLYAINLLQDSITQKLDITDEARIEILGTLMVYVTIQITDERYELKEQRTYGEVTESQFRAIYHTQKERFEKIYKFPGKKLYDIAKSSDLMLMKPSVRSYLIDGINQFVEVCIRINNFNMAKSVCTYIINTLPQNFHGAFKNKMNRINRIHSDKNRVKKSDKLGFSSQDSDLAIRLKEAMKNNKV
ncbi:hypothetical protein J2I47_15030 [Fibrella sp. HMF5335]|uniref:NB-ARC domain-containing protein n=1 Tax=Fibrella rubiginis TaxID=2817060 RepID=A0A939K6S5_9BACT|nr:NB-ARC domain-containing protein [Fibrella rubiginis]MBO0937870.1 hypothetical protein [Fibrella rubiginis]